MYFMIMALQKGLMQIPIDLLGTRYNKFKCAANAIREQLGCVIHKRKAELHEGKASMEQDLFSFMLSNVNNKGKSLTDDQVNDNFILLLFGGHESTNSTLTVLLNFLAKNPHSYGEVLRVCISAHYLTLVFSTLANSARS